MTNIDSIRRGLGQLAELAPNYTDAGAAVAAARGRRSRRRMIAASIAAILVIALGIGVGTQRVRGTGRGPQPSNSAGTPILTLPPVVTPPAGDVPPLPTDRAVGRAVLAYRTCAPGCPTYLLMADGRQYRLDVRTDLAPQFLPVSVSPQGRWLAISDNERDFEIRDLLGTAVHRESTWVNGVVGWSRNDRYAFGEDAVIDLNTWRVRPVSRPADRTFVAGVSDDGRIVETVNENDPTVLGLATLSYPGTFNMIEATDMLDPDEIVAEDFTQAGDGGSIGTDWNEVALGPGNQMAVVVFSTHFQYTGGYFQSPRRAILLGEYATGQLTRRVDLPAHAGAPFYFGDQPVFALQANPSAPIRLEQVSPAGMIVPICELPPTANYIVAGMRSARLGPADPAGIEPGL